MQSTLNMNKSQKILNHSSFLFYALTIGLCIVLKLYYRESSSDELGFILSPTSYAVSFFSGLEFTYLPAQGYWNEVGQVLIDKSCAGMNFWVIAFSLAVFTSMRFYEGIQQQSLLFLILLIVTFLLTIIANTFRIMIAILMLKLESSVSFLKASWWHTIEGSFVYLSILITFYLLSQYIHPKIRTYHAKPA